MRVDLSQEAVKEVVRSKEKDLNAKWPEEFDGKVYQFQEGPTGEEGRIWQTKVKVKRVVRYQWHLNDLRRSHPKMSESVLLHPGL